jgi:hypothetical protein
LLQAQSVNVRGHLAEDVVKGFCALDTIVQLTESVYLFLESVETLAQLFVLTAELGYLTLGVFSLAPRRRRNILGPLLSRMGLL